MSGFEGKTAEEMLRILKRDKILSRDFFTKEFNAFKHWDADADALIETRENVGAAVSSLIDKYQQGFTQSSTSFSRIIEGFSGVQTNLKKIEESLDNDGLLDRAAAENTLGSLWFESEVGSKMLRTLDKLELLVNVPSLLDDLMEKLQFLHCIRIINIAMGLLCENDLADIPALGSMHKDLLQKRHKLEDLLIAEVGKQIYMPSHVSTKRRTVKSTSSVRGSMGRVRGSLGRSKRGRKRRPSIVTSASVRWTSPSPDRLMDRTLEADLQSMLSTPHSASGVTPTPKFQSSAKLHAFSNEDEEHDLLSVAIHLLSFESPEDSADWISADSVIGRLFQFEDTDAYVDDPMKKPDVYRSIVIETIAKCGKIPKLLSTISKATKKSLRDQLDKTVEEFKTTLAKLDLAKPVSPNAGVLLSPRSSLAAEQSKASTEIDLLNKVLHEIFRVFIRTLNGFLDVIDIIRNRVQSRKGDGVDHSDPLHGTTALGSGDEKPRPFDEFFVWEEMQHTVSRFLAEFLEVSHRPLLSGLQSVISDQYSDESQAVARVLTFSFAGSLVDSVSKLGLNGSAGAGSRPVSTIKTSRSTWIQASPYLVTSMWKPVIEFAELGTAMVGSLSEEGSVLRSFLVHFVATTFISRVRSDSEARLHEIFSVSSAFNVIRESSREKHTAPEGFVKCTGSIINLITSLFSDFSILQYDVSSFNEILTNILVTFLSQSIAKFMDASPRSFIWTICNLPESSSSLAAIYSLKESSSFEACIKAQINLLHDFRIKGQQAIEDPGLKWDPSEYLSLAPTVDSVDHILNLTREQFNSLSHLEDDVPLPLFNCLQDA